ncbi:DUF791-domain-containing protein [Xylariaceae sp. FL0255]|nr:DUF791-domain-containing protein [Xylariaceae sp. FL0255]
MSFFYHLSLGGLIVLCSALFTQQLIRDQQLKRKDGDDSKKAELPPRRPDNQNPEIAWYKAYGLAMAADWMQGPYLFSLYRDDHDLSTSAVSTFFMADFISTAISAYFIGTLADKHGRKRSCMVYCLLYSLSCLCTITPSTPLLLLGRILGGMSTSILFTVFDSWMVTNFREQKLAERDGCDLSRTYATNSVLNSGAAIVSGLVGEIAVWATGSKKAPFILSVGLLLTTLHTIWSQWGENYGSKAATSEPAPTAGQTTIETPSSPALLSIFKKPQILALTLASTIFEGSMYLFVFYWTPTLTTAQTKADDLPYGIIFSSFMASSMAAALGYNIAMNRQLIKHSQLLVVILSASVFCFAQFARAGARSEGVVFWLFCLFEGCVGIYWPCVGYLKGHIVDDSARTQVYSVMRIPLNIFVVVSLFLAGEGDTSSRVFSICSVLLAVASATVWVVNQRYLAQTTL